MKFRWVLTGFDAKEIRLALRRWKGLTHRS